MALASGKTVDAAELAETYRRTPIDEHGKLRFLAARVTSPVGGVAAGSTLGFGWLPPGRKRILPSLSRLSCGVFGAARTLHVGHGAYSKRPPIADTTPIEPESNNALANAIDVSAALNSAVLSTLIRYDMYSLDEVLIFGTVNGGTFPAGITVDLLLAYLYE
jgi:hypothetical protein